MSYQYDDYGNRKQLSVIGSETYTINYTYDKNNRMRNQTKTAGSALEITDFWYDPNGNQISSMTVSTRISGTPAIGIHPGGNTTSSFNEYNSWNQITSTMQNGKNSSYTYNGDGLRMSKTVDGVTTSHIWDGTNIAADVNNGAVTKYVRGIHLISSKIGSDESFYTYNGHGDVVQLTTESGSITKQYNYDAFGVEQNRTENDVNPFRYCGEYYDSESGNIYLRARYYDSNIGRFISEDSYWNSDNMIYGDNKNHHIPNINAITQSSNIYAYCTNNPVRYIDILGNDVQVVWISYSTNKSFVYDRDKAVAYSQEWYNKRNSAYPDFGSTDCTNFVSQCLFDGGIPTSNKWKNYMGYNRKFEYVLKATDAWSNANESYNYFADSNTGIGKYVVIVYSSRDVIDAAYSGYLKPGDVLYFSNGGTDSIYHAALIVGIYDGEIYYAAHSNDHAWKALGSGFFKQQESDSPNNFNAVYIMHFFPEGA